MYRSSYIQKKNGKYCVKSKKNPNWSGGCYNTKAEAEKALARVEMFKHMKSKKRKSSEPIDLFNQYLSYAEKFAGADIYERFDELTQAINTTKDSECVPTQVDEEVEQLSELDELLHKRDDVSDAIKSKDEEKTKRQNPIAASKACLDAELNRVAISNPRLAAIIGKVSKQMKPTDVAAELRTIAGVIDSSKRPSVSLVVKDINRMITALEHEATVPGMEWLDDNALLKLSEELVFALKGKSPEKLEKVVPKIVEQLKNYEFRAKAERQRKQSRK
jgi:hypothetical protein